MSHARLLVVEDDVALREALGETLELAGYHVTLACDGYQALDILSHDDVSMVISDVQMDKMDGHTLLKQIKARQPQVPVLLMTAHGSISKAVQAMREGALDYLVKPFEATVIINMVNRYVPQQSLDDHDMLVVDERSQEVAVLAARVARSDATVMITGESGVGKEVLARYIHQHSNRAKGPFVAINCAAIPENMLEATLFGYEKGAFTGAYKSSPGKFEQAQGGTLLLDEISEMDLGLQAKLLRVLQEREVERLGGGGQVIPLDVRVLATSNRQMRDYVKQGKFREDLFYRLNVFPIPMPSLRERPKDIIPLVLRMLEQGAQDWGRPIPQLSVEARQRLMSHSWPGNVRELHNVIQRALILQGGDVIEKEDIQFEMADEEMPAFVMSMNPHQDDDGVKNSSLGVGLKSHEYNLIIEALEQGNGSRKKASEVLGISPRTLRYKLAKMREEGFEVPGNVGMENA